MNNEKRTKNTGMGAALLCLAVLAVFGLMFACSDPLGEEGGNASFTLTVGGGGSRSAVKYLPWERKTQVATLVHTITLTNASGVSLPPRKGLKAGDTANFSVAPGHWKISVKAYTSAGDLKAEGSTSVNLKRGRNPAVTVDMRQPGGGDKTGGIDVTVEF